MASVRLDFVPAELPDMEKLIILESATKGGVFSVIETVTAIGDYPNYLSWYTTDQALSITDWFAIQWEDEKGAKSDISDPIQGGTTTPVQIITQRVLQRDSSLDENIVVQSAEYVISQYLHVDDPYDPELVLSYRQLEGLTLMTLARSSVQTFISGASSGESYTAGLVSQKSETSTKQSLDKLLEYLVKEANRVLGITNSYIFVLPDIDPTGIGSVSGINWDHSRLALTINYE